MEKWLTERIHEMFRLARKDARYAQMQKRYQELEGTLHHRLHRLPEDVQEIFWEYLCLSDAMNWRILELVLGGFPLQEKDGIENSVGE